MFTGLRFGWLWLSKPFWDPIFWGVFGAPPVLEPILVGIEPDVHWAPIWMAVVVKTVLGSHLLGGFGAPPVLEPIFVWIEPDVHWAPIWMAVVVKTVLGSHFLGGFSVHRPFLSLF